MKKSIKHIGQFSGRLQYPGNERELAFARQWTKENKPGINRSLLLQLVCHDSDGRDVVRELEQQEATTAATVIQWLGSNVGWSFLQEALESCGYKIVTKDGGLA